MRRFCNPASFMHPARWNVLVDDDDDDVTYSQNTSSNCVSSMADVDGSGTLQSQVLKRIVAFKRKLLGSSSVLPSAVLEMAATKSESVLSQQSNSVEMPDDYSEGAKRQKVEHMHNVSISDSTVLVISEDYMPLLNTSEEHCKYPESLESDVLLMGDELSALFDSDNQRESSTNAATSSHRSNFSTLHYDVYYYRGSAARPITMSIQRVTMTNHTTGGG